ncbi:MAG: hypothetical protein H0W74_06830 [Sphingosinicella sp.]|nr:hypothetical protein [Sphingosinicella sp.]
MLAELAADPRWFPQAFDPASNRVLLVRKNERDYRAASFLDQRSLGPNNERMIVSWEDLEGAIPGESRADAHFIFHIGHVGSTLISRLLGEAETVLALREPLIIRAFAEISPVERASRMKVLQRLLARTFRPQQRSIVKATSFTSEIASELVPDGSRALFLYATARHYIEGILAGDTSRQELKILAPSRQQRLAGRCRELGPARSEAIQAAVAWACEMTSLEGQSARLPSASVMWLDFDRFLEDPARHLADIADFFDVPLGAQASTAICSGTLMQRYSKALEYEYSPGLRREVLADARRRHGPAIDEAIEWLAAGSRNCSLLAAAIGRAS